MKNRIAQLRKERSLTLKQLGQDLKIRDSTLSQYETGKRIPQLGVWIEIANYFNVSLEYLLYETSKRDYIIKSNDDALNVLKLLTDNKLSYNDLSNRSAIDLVIWISKHYDDFVKKDKYKPYTATATWFLHNFESERNAIVRFNKSRISSFNKENEILELFEDDNYQGATSQQVLDFMKASNNKASSDIDDIINKM